MKVAVIGANLIDLVSYVVDIPQRGFMRSLNSVEASPYSLACALILTGCAKQPLHCHLSGSAYFYLFVPSFRSICKTLLYTRHDSLSL